MEAREKEKVTKKREKEKELKDNLFIHEMCNTNITKYTTLNFEAL